MAHFIQYIPRHVVTVIPVDPESPWYSQQQPDSAGFFRPDTHVLASDVIANSVAAGDTIWVISQLHGPQGAPLSCFLPVALDARIDVVEVAAARLGGIEAKPGPRSCWFRLADATPLLADLNSITATRKTTNLAVKPNTKVGTKFQSMRRIEDALPLLAWSEWLHREPFDFISYRHADGTYAAFRKVLDLIQREKRIVFWDRWGLPRRLAERREGVSSPTLDAHLEAVMHAAAVVHGVESPSYRDSDAYSLREARLAEQLARFQAVPWMPAPPMACSRTRDPWRVVKTDQ